MIKILDLQKRYKSLQVLAHINLEFRPGHIYGIVGENGAGKTTLFRCLTGLEPFDGKITSDNANLLQNIGYMPTDAYYFPYMTGREFIQLLCNAKNKQLVDLDTKNIFALPLDRYVEQYSTGMQKKLAFLGLLMQENDFYILDEPFNGVDLQSNIIISEILLKLKSLGKIIVISSHIFSTLSEICDEIHLLKNMTIDTTAKKHDFIKLEKMMKEVLIGEKIAQLNLK